MGPLNLSRIKLEDSFSFRVHTKTNIKKENVWTPVKLEPKIEFGCIYRPIQDEFISSSPDTKPIKLYTETHYPENDTKMKNNRRKMYSSNSVSPVHRRPVLPTAIRLHKYLTARDPDTLTKRELVSLNWAESVIVYTILKRGEESQSNETLDKVPNPFSKNALKSPLKDDSSILNSLQLEIVDFGSLDRKYTIEKAKIIESAFNKAVIDHILSRCAPTTPRYGLPSWRNGVLVLDCKDTYSYRFAQDTVINIIPWRKAILRAIPPKPDNFTYIGEFHAPDIDIRKEDVIRVLESQNPRINMQSWRVIEERTVQPGFKTYYLSISQPPVKFLKNKCLKLLFGATELSLEFVKTEFIS